MTGDVVDACCVCVRMSVNIFGTLLISIMKDTMIILASVP